MPEEVVEQKDPRYLQLEMEFGTELESAKGNRSFVGFGRSTDTMKDLDFIGQKYQESVGALNTVITTEKAIKEAAARGASREEMESLFSALSSARAKMDKLKQESAGRRTQLLQAGNQMGQQAQDRVQQLLQPRGGISVALPQRKSMGIKVARDPEGAKTASPQIQKIFIPIKRNTNLVSPQKMHAAFERTPMPSKKNFSITK